MKRFVHLLLLCLGVLQHHTGTAVTVYESLFSVNRQLLFQPDIPVAWSRLNAHTSMLDPVRLHLSLVEQTLRKRPVDHLTAAQRASRLHLLDHLHAYYLAGTIPINDRYGYQTPIFIDPYDHFCAVGYLMKMSGYEHLARSVQRTQNTAYLADIVVEGLEEWIRQSGFSAAELAWIQPGYAPFISFEPLGNGVNGTVYDMTFTRDGHTVAGGLFSEAGGEEAGNVAIYRPGIAGYFWQSTGNGLNDTVFCLEQFGGTVIAGGSFTHSGSVTVNHVARYRGGEWEPMGSGINGTVYDLAVWNDTLYAAGRFTYSKGEAWNLAYWDGSEWQAAPWRTNGPVYTLHPYGDGLYIGGEFTVVNDMPVQNIARLDRHRSTTSFGEGIAIPVHALVHWNDTLTAGGRLRYRGADYGILRWKEDHWQPLEGIGYMNETDSSGICYTLRVDGANKLVAGGQLLYLPLMGYWGKNLLMWYSPDGEPQGMASLDSTTYTIREYGNLLYIGGAFRQNGQAVLNGAATTYSPAYLKGAHAAESLHVYPVPATGDVTLEHTGTLRNGRLYSASGKLVSTFALNGPYRLSRQAPGLYFLILDNGQEQLCRKLVWE